MDILTNGSLSLERMIMDTRIRKINNMLYMPNPQNHPIVACKINEWVELQCSDEAKILANLFKDNTKYISWIKFYSNSIKIFEELYNFIGDSAYCFFTKGKLGNKSWTEKSNYWMINLLLDYYINTGKTNFPKELLIWDDKFNKETNYDYYIVIDDVSYSGGQSFNDSLKDDNLLKVINIPQQKILIVVPYISELVYNKYYINKERNSYPKYNKLFYSIIMNYWWLNKKVVIDSHEYDLNISTDRDIIYTKIKSNFMINGQINDGNSMYYFDHKVADYVSSFPQIYQQGIIKGYGNIEKFSANTHNFLRKKSNVCLQAAWLPFLGNCTNTYQILGDDLNKLCIEPWYKKTYNNQLNTYYRYILALDFDLTITDKDIGNSEDIANTYTLDLVFKNKDFLIEILNLAWKYLITIYIVSRRNKKQIIILLKRFYKANNITYQQIYEENIFGMSDDYTKPTGRLLKDENTFWAIEKLKNLNDIVKEKKINKEQILFLDDNKLNIETTSNGGFSNSFKIIERENSIHVLELLNSFIKNYEIPLYDTNSKNDKKYILVVDLYSLTTLPKYLSESTAKLRSLDTIFRKKDFLIKILNLAFDLSITIYIISKANKKNMITLLRRFYDAENITYQQIHEENIYGRHDYDMTGIIYSENGEVYYKLEYLNNITKLNQVNKKNILYLDNTEKVIHEARNDNYTNSFIIDKCKNAEDILDKLQSFIKENNIEVTRKQEAGRAENDYYKKYLKYKKKYLELRK